MVFRHTEAPLSEFVTLFHMAIFFIASGFLYNAKRVTDFKQLCGYIFRKIKSLWLPYFLFSALFICLNNLFLKLNIYTDNVAFLEKYTGSYAALGTYYSFTDTIKKLLNACIFNGGTQIGGALWFFQTLFCLTVGYAVIDYVIRKFIKNENIIFIIQGIVSIVFLIIGYVFHVKGITILAVSRFFSFYCLIYLGYAIKHYKIMDFIKIKKWIPVTAFVVSFVVLLVLYPFGYIDLSSNEIENPIYFIAVSVAGWVFMYSLAIMLQQIKFFGNSAIAYLSIHSISIIGVHFLAFKIVNLLAVCVLGMDFYMIAAFPVLMHGAWWIAYFIVGLSVPLLIDKLYLIMKNICINQFNKRLKNKAKKSNR